MKDKPGKNYIDHLPTELFFHIFKFINIKDLLSCSQVSKSWHSLSNDDLVWTSKCRQITFLKTKEFHDLLKYGSTLKQQYIYYLKLFTNWQCNHEKESIRVSIHSKSIITGLIVFDQWIASCSDDWTISVLDLVTGERIRFLRGHEGGVWSLVALAIYQKPYIASSSADCTVRLWDFVEGRCVHVFRGHENIVRCLVTVQIDNSNKPIKLISGSRDSTIRIWDVFTRKCDHLLEGHTGAIRCVQASSVWVVSGSYDCTVRVWDIRTGICAFVLNGHTDRVYTIHLGATVILSASLDTTIRVWDIHTGICIHVLVGHKSLTSGMVMNSDESLVVSGNADSTIRVWRVSTGECILELLGQQAHTSPLTGIQIVLDKFIVSSELSGTVKLWNLDDGVFLRDIIQLKHSFPGAMMWRAVVSNTHLVCAVGTGNRLDFSKLYIFDFSVKSPCDY